MNLNSSFTAVSGEQVSPPDSVCPAPASGTAGNGWLEEIRRLYALGKSRTFELAWAVYSARESMARGQWAKLWRAEHAPFSRTRGCMLRRIGERFGNPNVQTIERLPGEWSILYELSRLDLPTIQNLMERGLIHSGMSGREAKELVRGILGTRRCSARSRLERWLNNSRNFLRDLVAELPSAAQQSLGRQLRDLVGEVAQFTAPATSLQEIVPHKPPRRNDDLVSPRSFSNRLSALSMDDEL